MILTLMLLLSNAYAESGVGDCDEGAYALTDAVFVEGEGCLVAEIGALCKERHNSDCESWVQVVTRVTEEGLEIYGALLDDCVRDSAAAHRFNASEPGRTAYYYYDEDGFLVTATVVSSGAPFCCEGVETPAAVYGDPAAVCEVRDRADKAPRRCGAASGGGGAAVLAALAALAARRRRQP